MQIDLSYVRPMLTSLGLLLAVCQNSSIGADIVDLEILSGTDSSLARGVSENGIVTGSSSGATVSEAFRWSGGQMSGLGLLQSGSYSDGYGISADGTRIAGTADTNDTTLIRAFLWNGSYQVIEPLNGGTYTSGYGISADGTFVVGESDSTTTSGLGQAFRWSAENGIQGLGVLDGQNSSTALGASANGAVVVGVSGSFGFRWESEVMSSLGTLTDGTFSAASGTSSDGAVVVGYADDADGNTRAFRWEAGGMSDLGVLQGANDSSALAVSPDGYLTVGVSGSDAFLWRSGQGMEKLQDVLANAGVIGIGTWSSLAAAYAISGNANDGYSIAGYGMIGSDQRAFLVTGLFAVPEPSGYAMAFLTASLCFLLSRHRLDRSQSSPPEGYRFKAIPPGRIRID